MSTGPEEAEPPFAPPKKSKSSLLLTGFVGLCFAVAAIARFAGFLDGATSQVEEANSLKDQANASIDAGEKRVVEIDKLYAPVFTEENLNGIPGTRGTLQADAEKGRAACDAGAIEFRKAASLFSQASSMRINEHYKAYLELKAKQLGLFADVCDNLGKQFALILDPAETDGPKLKAKIDAVDLEFTSLVKQRNDTGAQAEKVTTDHPEVFTAN